MQVRAEDRNKAILLIVAIVAILGFVVYSMMGALGKKEQPVRPVSTQPSTVILDNGGPATNVESVIPETKGDPFRKTVDLSPKTATVTKPGSSGSTVRPPGNAIEPFDEGPLPGSVEPTPAKLRARLDGVLIHRTGTAVFSVGDRVHYLGEGDELLSLRVVRVARGGAVVRFAQGPRRWVEIGADIDIPLGKTQNMKD